MRRIKLALLIGVVQATATSTAAVSEYDLKAAFLLNVLRLSERRSPLSSNELTLCTVAPGAVEQPLRSLEGATVRGRKLTLRNIAKGQLEGCEAVFFGRSAGSESMIAKANALGLLTIGNDREFLPCSGLVAFVVEDRRIVVEINRVVLKHGPWVFSSHLLEIARLL